MKGNCVRQSWLALWVTLLLAFAGSFRGYGQISAPPPEEAAASQTASSEQSAGGAPALVNTEALLTASGSDGAPATDPSGS
ncbi:MAG: hypothetical protein PHO89_10030, partial [Methylacidiphilaceae bacterium]|nr:hypothetical protein [Candidatus Methylacidiphilaceae bacterium]